MRSKLTYANVVASISLFLVLAGGTAFAAQKFILGSKIKPHTITGKQIKKKSLSAVVFKGQLPQGLQGATGPRGATGAAGATKVLRRKGATVTATPGIAPEATATCNPGEVLVSGGAAIVSGTYADFQLANSSPTTSDNRIDTVAAPNGWLVRYYDRSAANNISFAAYAVCASP